MPTILSKRFNEPRRSYMENLHVDWAVALIAEHLAIRRQLIFTVRCQENQRLSLVCMAVRS